MIIDDDSINDTHALNDVQPSESPPHIISDSPTCVNTIDNSTELTKQNEELNGNNILSPPEENVINNQESTCISNYFQTSEAIVEDFVVHPPNVNVNQNAAVYETENFHNSNSHIHTETEIPTITPLCSQDPTITSDVNSMLYITNSEVKETSPEISCNETIPQFLNNDQSVSSSVQEINIEETDSMPADNLEREGSYTSETSASIITAINVQGNGKPQKSSSESLRQLSLQLSGLVSDSEDQGRVGF